MIKEPFKLCRENICNSFFVFSPFHSFFIISVAKKEACELEGSCVSMSCSNGELINVVDAIYGHLQTDVCSSQHFDKTCSANVLSVVSDRLLNEKVKNPLESPLKDPLNNPLQVQFTAELFNSGFKCQLR